LLEDPDEIVAHASVVPRSLKAQGRLWRTGFVEAVATDPSRQERGHGSTVMRAVATHIADEYELGALSTGENAFYERLGWEMWHGPTGVRTEQGVQLTPDEDGGVMVLRTPRSASIDLGAELTCEWRPGDVW
jgi:aminoglycoside 2'-N-acetyltransferase I